MAYQERENYSEQTIQKLLFEHFKDMKYQMSNIYMFGGNGTRWESDFFFMTKTKQLWEIEIKVDKQDFDRDFQLKPKKHEVFRKVFESEDPMGNFVPNAFYFCAPEGVIPHDMIPEYAGLIEIHGENKDQVRFVGSHPKIHTKILDATEDLLEKFYKKSLSLEKMLADFRINLYENPENESEILKKFLKRIRM